VRNGSHVFYALDSQSQITEGADRAFSAYTGAFYKNVHFLQTGIHGFLSSGFGSSLRGIRGRLLSPLETETAGTGPGDSISPKIGYGDDGVVKRRLNMNLTFEYCLLLFFFLLTLAN
jgi:hypothetical protein